MLLLTPPLSDPIRLHSDRCPHPLIRAPSANRATPWPDDVLCWLCRSPPHHSPENGDFVFPTPSYPFLPLYSSLSLSIPKSPFPSLFLLKVSPHLASSSLGDPPALSTMTNYLLPESPSPPLLLFLLKISPLLASSSLGEMPTLSARTILLTFSFSNCLFSYYLFSHYLFSYSIPHGLQRLPRLPFVILPHGL